MADDDAPPVPDGGTGEGGGDAAAAKRDRYAVGDGESDAADAGPGGFDPTDVPDPDAGGADAGAAGDVGSAGGADGAGGSDAADDRGGRRGRPASAVTPPLPAADADPRVAVNPVVPRTDAALPFIYDRRSATSRNQMSLYATDATARRLDRLRRDLDAHFDGEEVQDLDVREAAVVVGLHRPAAVVAVLEAWGYGMRGD